MKWKIVSECKPSDIEWLGDIQSIWELVPFKTIFCRQERPGVWRHDLPETEILLLRIGNVNDQRSSQKDAMYFGRRPSSTEWNHSNYRYVMYRLVRYCDTGGHMSRSHESRLIGSTELYWASALRPN